MNKINKEIATMIFGWQYWMKKTSVPKRKQKRMIINYYVDSGMNKRFPVDAFPDTWNALHKIGLVERKR